MQRKENLNSTESLNHICAVVVQVPQLPIVTLVSPPERIVPCDLILLELRSDAPALGDISRDSLRYALFHASSI